MFSRINTCYHLDYIAPIKYSIIIMKDILGIPMKWIARYYYTILVVWITLTLSSCGLRFGDYNAYQDSKNNKTDRYETNENIQNR